MHADEQHSGRQHHRRGGHGKRHARWPYKRAMMSLPGCQQRALDRIEQALVAEDPRLGLRFAFFTRLTRHEAMPETEQVPGPLQRSLRRAVILPPLAISLVSLLAGSWLMPSRQTPAARPRALTSRTAPPTIVALATAALARF
jgi:hypothetical protein